MTLSGPAGPRWTRRTLLTAIGASALSPVHACAPPRPRLSLGVDVSADNGSVDWRAAASAGVDFAYLRASQGARLTDPRYAENAAAARAAALVQGAYHVFDPSVAGADQAARFLQSARFRRGDLPPMLDLETGPRDRPPSAVRTQIEAWLSAVSVGLRDHLGSARAPGLYLRKDIWEGLGSPDWSAYPLWIAEWNVQAPHLPAIWPDYAFWQYSDVGRIDGVDGPVDLSRGSAVAHASLL